MTREIISIAPSIASNTGTINNEFELSGPRLAFQEPESTSSGRLIIAEVNEGKQNVPNIIRMRKNTPERTYTGGSKDDIFLLTQLTRDLRPHNASVSQLQGSEGADWVVIADEPAVRHYTVDLADKNSAFSGGNVYYSLKEIENIIGHAKSADQFTGNEAANQLWGGMPDEPDRLKTYAPYLDQKQMKEFQLIHSKGKNKNKWVEPDVLSGAGGNDVLAGWTGYLTGGEGEDIYLVLALRQAEPGNSITINNLSSSQETDEIQLPGLNLIKDVLIQLEGPHFVITPKDPHFHQRILLENFTLGTSWQHIRIKDNTGSIYVPAAIMAEGEPQPARLRQIKQGSGDPAFFLPLENTQAINNTLPASPPSSRNEHHHQHQIISERKTAQRTPLTAMSPVSVSDQIQAHQSQKTLLSAEEEDVSFIFHEHKEDSGGTFEQHNKSAERNNTVNVVLSSTRETPAIRHNDIITPLIDTLSAWHTNEILLAVNLIKELIAVPQTMLTSY